MSRRRMLTGMNIPSRGKDNISKRYYDTNGKRIFPDDPRVKLLVGSDEAMAQQTFRKFMEKQKKK